MKTVMKTFMGGEKLGNLSAPQNVGLGALPFPYGGFSQVGGFMISTMKGG
jgi:hypothetical protein